MEAAKGGEDTIEALARQKHRSRALRERGERGAGRQGPAARPPRATRSRTRHRQRQKSNNGPGDGGAGADTLSGGGGNDLYLVDQDDLIVEESGQGYESSGVRPNGSLSNAENVEELVLIGDANIIGRGNEIANTITGNSGNNELSGSGGDDTLIGGTGKRLSGWGHRQRQDAGWRGRRRLRCLRFQRRR